MLNYNAQRDDRIVELERMVVHQTTVIASLCGHLGTLEDALRRVQEEPSRPSTPEVIDLTLDEEEDEYVTSSSVIDLSNTDVEDDIVDLLGGPIEIQVDLRADLKSNHLVTKRCPLLPWISGVAAGVLIDPN